MGSSNQKLVAQSPKENKELRVFISGLYSAGKSTVLHVTKYGKVDTMMPIFGVDFEKIEIGNISMTVMQEGGRSGSRALQRIYYHWMTGLIFVVDSNDRERIDEAREELHQMLNDKDLQNKSILILGNKQDLSNAMTFDELYDKLNLTKLNDNIKWHLQLSSAIRNEGLHEGFKWLANSMNEKSDPVKPIAETIEDATKMKNHFMSILKKANLKTLFKKIV